MTPLENTLVVPQPDDALEIDAVWSFVKKKGERVWVWVALAYQSRQVVAMVIGDRSERTCRKLWQRIPDAYRSLQVYTDFHKAYFAVVPREQHTGCKKGSGLTNSVERFNLTLRHAWGGW
ncbi:MAG: hypothetical protein OHK0029_05910 [Armatimonadaceae bacterium]